MSGMGMRRRGGGGGGGAVQVAGSALFVNGMPVVRNLSSAAAAYATSLNSYEILSQSLYDSAAYPAAGINQLTFFQYPIGAGTGVISNVAKTAEDTNMQAAGQLPAGQAYICSSIEVEIQPGVSSASPAISALAQPSVLGAAAVNAQINDAYTIRSTGYLNFNIGSKAYMTEGPLMKFPASNDFEVMGAASNATTAAASLSLQDVYGKAVGPSYELAPNNLFLIPNMNFNVQLLWATKQATVSTLQARIFVRLMGQLIRAAQ